MNDPYKHQKVESKPRKRTFKVVAIQKAIGPNGRAVVVGLGDTMCQAMSTLSAFLLSVEKIGPRREIAPLLIAFPNAMLAAQCKGRELRSELSGWEFVISF
jgi:hypothetical protein